jgi:dihydroflavonol-4-reductase
MLVLVTGATGFLGAHVVQALLRQGDEVRALVRPHSLRNHVRRLGVEFVEGDLLDAGSLERACAAAQGVVHCAAIVSYWSRQNAQQRAVNVTGSLRLLEASHAAGVKRIVHVSSAAVVGARRGGEVIDENEAWEHDSERIHYVRTKRRAEEHALAAAWGGLPIVVVNPSTILGPRLDGHPPSPLIAGIRRGRLPWIPPGGVSITDVSDVAAATVRALRAGRPGERYLLAGHNVTWEQLYQAIADHAGGRVPRRKLSARRLRWLELLAAGKDALRLSRPPWTPEVYRSFGTYAWFRSDKAARELDYVVRPLPEILRHATRGYLA